MEEHVDTILREIKTIAVVGLSRDPNKVSYSVAEYMRRSGYNIVPINPMTKEIMGSKCYSSISALPDHLKDSIDLVNIFRKSADVNQIVMEAIELRMMCSRPDVIWMQLGIFNQEAADHALNAGMKVVMDRCIRTEHKRLGIK